MSVTKTCRISGKEFIISGQEIALLDKLSPVIGGEKFQIPLPTLCPEERVRRRANFKNYFFLHKRTCDLTNNTIISGFGPMSESIIWNQKDYSSDLFDPLSYGNPILDVSPVCKQISDLIKKVPQVALDNAYLQLENSDYVNGNGKSKDCYLVSCGADNEKCLYAYYLFGASHIFNVVYCRFSENCSFSNHLYKCYDVHFSFDIPECRNSWYIFSCRGSHHLIGCVGLENQSYQILNEGVSPAVFDMTLQQLKTDKNYRDVFLKKLKELIEKTGITEHILTGSTSSTGDFCYDSKNCYLCYCSADSTDSAYLYNCHDTHDSMDINDWGGNLSLSYDSMAIGENSSHIYWSQGCWGNAHYHFYCHNCTGGSYLFGCSGLENRSYCIYNKEYTKDAWEAAIRKIFHQMGAEGTWGEFLDAQHSWYPYDASFAMTLFPLTKQEALDRGLQWSDYAISPEGVTKTIPANKLPYDITKIPDDVLNWAILCERTMKPYKIQPLELDLHRKYGIPLPKIHPMERIQKLFKWNERDFDFDF